MSTPKPIHESSACGGPPPQAQRSTGTERHLGTQVRDSEEGKPHAGPSQGCLRKGSAPQSRHETCQKESTSEHRWDQEKSLPSTWDMLWGAIRCREEHSGIARGLLEDAQGRNYTWGNRHRHGLGRANVGKQRDKGTKRASSI